MVARHLILTLLLITAAPAAAQPQAQMRTDELMWQCEGVAAAPVEAIAFCVGYLSGFTDLNSVIKQMTKWSPFCLPAQGVSRDQVRLVFVKWAKDHPSALHESARVSVMLALDEAFPCAR